MSNEKACGQDAASSFLRGRLDDAQGSPSDAGGGITLREEANALVAYAFRNGFLEDLHAGVAGFSDEEMKKLMIEASAALACLLFLKREATETYAAFLRDYGGLYCRGWERTATAYKLKEQTRRPCSRCQKQIRSSWSFCPSCGAPQKG